MSKVLIVLFLFFSSSAFAGTSVSSEYLVKVRDGNAKGIGILSHLERQFGKNFNAHTLKTDRQLYVVRLTAGTDPGQALKRLSALPGVEYAELNGTVHALSEPNDPDFQFQYALRNVGQKDGKNQVGAPGKDIDVLPVWDHGITGDRKVVVAIIDSGIDLTHPDLAGNIYTNPKETQNGKDDDGNGFIDDIHGWNFVDDNNKPQDGYGHGSHISGIIGAVANNGIGVTGIAWNVSLLPIKALDNNGDGRFSTTVDAINYARKMKANIINISWGSPQYSRAMEAAIQKAARAGILVVTSAGNDGNDNDRNPYYPANFHAQNLLAVAAIDNQGKLPTFSNFGKTTVAVAAPGVSIYSTFKDGKYFTGSGTSMAAPQVVGEAVLMLSAHPEWTASEIDRRIVGSCAPEPGLKDKVACGGYIDIDRAIFGL